MKVFDDVRIKENVKRYELAPAVEAAVNMVIYKDENGEVVFNPCYQDFALFYNALVFFVDGIEFEEHDTYLTIQENEKVNALVNDFMKETDYDIDFWDLLEFKKDLYIREQNSAVVKSAEKAFETASEMNKLLTKVAKTNVKILEKQLEAAEKNNAIAEAMSPEEIADLNRMLLSGKLDLDRLSENIAKNYADIALSDSKTNEILEEKNRIIRDLQAYKEQTEKERLTRTDDGK